MPIQLKDRIYCVHNNVIKEGVVAEIIQCDAGNRYLIRTREDKFYAKIVYTTIDELTLYLKDNAINLTQADYDLIIATQLLC